MPVTLRNNKRRSLYITHNVKDLTKEALRPRSWYIPSSKEVADPYTSVRKLFYDFNKTAFYGEIGKDVNGSQIITNDYASYHSAEGKTNTKHSLEEDHKEGISLRDSFHRLEISKSNRSSMVLPPSQDKNNNNENVVTAHPIPVSPPRIPIAKPSNFIQRTVFSSRNSDTASLKEESSSYADFYVPYSSTTKQSNFLRRNYKRRSFDPSKLKALDYIHRVNIEEDKISVSSIGRHSMQSQPAFFNSKSRIDEIVDPKPMLERYLSDTEQDICAGVYPTADDSITIQGDLEEEDHLKSEKDSFIPWSKRASFIAATYKENPDPILPQPPPTYRKRNQGRFASFRRAKSIVSESSKQTKTSKKSSPFRRLNSLEGSTLRSLRSTTSTLRRQNSDITTLRKRRMSISSLNKQNDYPTLARSSVGDRSLKHRKSSHYKVDGAHSFFDRYQDTLRVQVFSVDLNKLSLNSDSVLSSESSSAASPTTPNIGKDPVFDYNFDCLSKEFDYKLVGRTYQQLFYLRSRLSASARKTEFMCDGSFGCGSCDVQCFPTWESC